ncbi:negative elongation factor E [Brevipalpus obovatus]|uniref:negative elongation factor E n=1 Tax=Brevipalpus obovatus TaxID=246614 RepID=UPI003D9F8FEB
MGFIQIPPQFTDEEKMLQQKYQTLNKKKKQLSQLKKSKVEKPDLINKVPLKKAGASKQDAKEVAKRLLKSGVIQVPKPLEKEKQDQGFKRAKSLMRKRVGIDRPAPFKPFSPPSSASDGDYKKGDSSREPKSDPRLSPPPQSSKSSPTNTSSTGGHSTGSATPHSWNSIAATYYRRSAPQKDDQDQREMISYDDL